MSELLSKIADFEDVFIFGCGNVGRHIYEQLVNDKVSATIRFCDNQHGTQHHSADVLAPEEAAINFPNALYIVGSIIHFLPMHMQLKDLGIPEKNIIARWVQTDSRLIPKPFIGNLPYHLTEHCNLKCAGCLHFSNIADEEFADIETFKETFKRFIDVMGTAFKGGIEIFGGEPLLHPKIEQFLFAARELIPGRTVSIITNGVLLTQMPESFWEACSRLQVHITISSYPINLDLFEIKCLASERGITVYISDRDKGAWSQYVMDLSGTQDMQKSFVNCENANERFILKDRYLYPCSVTACIEHFNKAFGQKLELRNEDRLDLFSDITAQDVLCFISTPVPFCRYCNREKLKLGQTWRLSERIIDEYLD